jgi:flagellar basal body-associated protein FliL
MADPIYDAAYGLAKGVTEAALDALAAKGPQLMTGLIGAWRAAWASTISDAPANPSLEANLRKQVNDAIKAGTLGGPGA